MVHVVSPDTMQNLIKKIQDFFSKGIYIFYLVVQALQVHAGASAKKFSYVESNVSSSASSRSIIGELYSTNLVLLASQNMNQILFTELIKLSCLT